MRSDRPFRYDQCGLRTCQCYIIPLRGGVLSQKEFRRHAREQARSEKMQEQALGAFTEWRELEIG